MSADPAMESYIPEASSNEGADKRNQNLPGMGGIYNSRNLQTYHYAGNNPLKYTDPSGRDYDQDPEYTSKQNEIQQYYDNLEKIIDAFNSPEWDKYRSEVLPLISLEFSPEGAVRVILFLWNLIEYGAAAVAILSSGGVAVLVMIGIKEGTKKLAFKAFQSAVVKLGMMLGRSWLDKFHAQNNNQKMTETEYWERALQTIDNDIENGTDEEKEKAKAARSYVESKLQEAKEGESLSE